MLGMKNAVMMQLNSIVTAAPNEPITSLPMNRTICSSLKNTIGISNRPKNRHGRWNHSCRLRKPRLKPSVRTSKRW